MQAGKILQANHDGVYVLKFQGDVRLTLCTALDDFIEGMFSDGDFASVVIDLSDAEGLDSTTLGLLAKIAVRSQRDYQFKPAVIVTDASIQRLLESMCFERIFDIRDTQLEATGEFGEIPFAAASEQEVKSRVLEAHRTLMGLSEENRACFKDLVETLEQTTPANQASH